jgi:hypothetical protein
MLSVARRAACSMTQEGEEWKLMSEQAERVAQQPASDETMALSATATASASADGAHSTRLPRAVTAAAERVSLQVRQQVSVTFAVAFSLLTPRLSPCRVAAGHDATRCPACAGRQRKLCQDSRRCSREDSIAQLRWQRRRRPPSAAQACGGRRSPGRQGKPRLIKPHGQPCLRAQP